MKKVIFLVAIVVMFAAGASAQDGSWRNCRDPCAK